MSERDASGETAPKVGKRRRRVEAPGSPRALLRAACSAPASPAVFLAAMGAARVARAARVEEAWRWAGEGSAEEHADRALSAAEVTRRYLRSSPGKPLPPHEVRRRLERAAGRAARCGVCGIVYTDSGRRLRWVMPENCRARVCFPCARSALRQRMDRWAPLTRAPLRGGHVASLVTIGSLGEVTDRAMVSGYLRRVARFCKGMRYGVPRFGIPARSWVAGLRALELMPRASGGWAHVHLWVVRRAFVPYGLSASAWRARLREHAPEVMLDLERATPTGAEVPLAAVLRALRDAGAPPLPEELGMRALLRSLGCGEVFRDDVLTRADEGAAAVENYMSKVERYMSKVENDAAAPGSPWGGRTDILAALRGVRLLEPWGDARGLLAGPDRVAHERDGARLTLDRVGRYDPEDPETWWTLPDGAAEADEERRVVERTTVYRADRLDGWAEWCDVAYLRRRLYTD